MVFSFNIHINKYGDIDLSSKRYFKTLLQFFMKTPNNLDEMIDMVKLQLDICDDFEQQYFYFDDKENYYSFSEKNKSLIRQFYYDFLDECNDTNKGDVLGVGMYYFMPIDENELIKLINHNAHVNKNKCHSDIIRIHKLTYYKIKNEFDEKYHKYILYLTNMTIRLNLCIYHRIRGGFYNDIDIRYNEFNYMGYITQGLLQ